MANKQIRQLIESPTQVLVADGVDPEANLGYYGLSSIGKALLGITTTSQGQEALSLVPGTNVQAYDADLAALAALTSTGLIDRTGAGTATTRATGTTGLAVLASADAAAARTAIGAAATSHTQDWSTITNRPTNLSGYGITDAQPLDSDLTALASLTATGLIDRTGAGTATTHPTGTAGLAVLAAADAAAARTAIAVPPINNPSFTGTVTASAATASTSTTTGALVVTGGLGVGGRTTTTGIQSETSSATNAFFNVLSTSTNVTASSGAPLSLRNSNNTPGNYAAIAFNDSQNNFQGSIGIKYGNHTDNFQGSFYIEPRGVSSPSSFVVSANGNVGIGTGSPESGLHVSGPNFASSTIRLQRTDSVPGDWRLGTSVAPGYFVLQDLAANQNRLVISDAGNIGIGANPASAARLTVSGTIRYINRPAAATITAIGFDANGDLRASSSSLRYKHDIQDLETGLEEVMQLRPVQFKFNGETRTNMGFIAEEVDELGLEDVMLYNEENQPEGVIYANMVSLLTKAIQEQQAQIEELKAEINLLKGV